MAGAAFNLSGSNANVTYNGSMTLGTGTGNMVNISDHDAGTINFNTGNLTKGSSTTRGIAIADSGGGTINFNNPTISITMTSTGDAVSLTGANAGGTINFAIAGGGNGLDITTASGTGFDATGGGTVSVTGSSNSITSTSGTALNVANTTIGASGLTFHDISAGNNTAAADPANGIVLNTTGNSGGLTVTGDGVNATLGGNGSGGTIQNTTGAAVSLTSTKNVSLNYLNITNPGTDGVNAQSIEGFTYNRGTLTDSSGAAADEGIQFGDFTTGTSVNGTIDITNSIIGPASGSAPHNNVGIGISGGTSTWNVTGNTFRNNGNADLNVEVRNTTNATMTVSGNTFAGNATASAEGIHMQSAGSGTTATLNATIQNNSFSNQNISIDVNDDISAHTTYKILTNTIVNDVRNDPPGAGAQTSSHAINAFMATTSLSGALMDLTIQGNIIGSSAIAGSGSSIGNGMRVNLNGNGVNHVLLDNNTIREAPLGRGIEVIGRNGTGSADVTVTNNNVDHRNLGFDTANASDFPLAAILVQVNQVGTAGYTIRANVHDNTVPSGTASDLGAGFLHLQQTQQTATTTLQLVDNAPASATAAAELSSHNTGSTSTSGTISLIAGPINTPPLMFAPSATDVTVPPSAIADQPLAPEIPPSAPDDTAIATPPSVGSAPLAILGDGVLSQAELDSLVASAIARWDAAGITSAQDALLHSVTFSIQDLPGLYLGEASAGHITLDADAAGNSWFIDATPNDDNEFTGASTSLAATASGGAASRVDALTTVLHELGHQLGLDDTYDPAAMTNLMYGYLRLSERRLPAAGQADGADPNMLAAENGPDFALSPITIGTLPAQKSVTVVFDATIPTSTTITSVSTQGVVMGTGINVSTDDPDVGGTQATITQIDLPNVSVAVAPAAVAEDGPGTLVYTFTRTGANDFARTVNFSVGGTGTLLTDYTHSGDDTFSGSAGTVTFAANSATATVTIDPSIDSTVEPDETIVLTVTPGTGYDVATPAAAATATGTITNDDTDVKVELLSVNTVSEDGSPVLVYTFTRTGVTTNVLQVNFAVTGTASAADDFFITAPSGTFTAGTGVGVAVFAANAATTTFTIHPLHDNVVEPDETTILAVTAATGSDVYNITGSPQTGTIENDDSDVKIDLLGATQVLEDGATNLVYTLTRTGFLANALVVRLTASGTAGLTGDYTHDFTTFNTSNGLATATFAANSATATVTINPTTDTTAEPDETVILTLNANGTPAATGGYSVATPAAATGTIIDDDTLVSVTVAPTSVAEDGATNLVYTFTRNGATTNPLTVNFSIGGTATVAGNDYSQSGATTFGATTGTVIIPIGSASASVTLDPTADTTVEADETATLTVTAGSGYVPGASPTVTGTITNDDTDVSVAVAPASVAEDGVTNLVYTFTRAGVLSGALTVFFTASGSATFLPTGQDYVASGSGAMFNSTAGTGIIIIPDGVPSAALTVNPTPDNDVESDETVTMTVTPNSSYNVTGSPATGTITNDDSEVKIAVSPATSVEDTGPNFVYTLTRTGSTVNALDVNVTVSGTAGLTGDYAQTGLVGFNTTTGTATVHFNAGSGSATVTIDPATDLTAEPDETVTLTLNANGAIAATGGYTVAPGPDDVATGTILNDDTIVSVAVAPASVAEDSPAGTLVYTFTRTGDTTNPLTVNFNAGGTAVSAEAGGNDYTQSGVVTVSGASETLTIPVGSSTATVTLNPVADPLFEADETAIFTVTPGAGYGVGGSPATGTITNDDPMPTLSISDETKIEGSAGTTQFVFFVTLSTASGATTTVDFITADGTALAGGDYTATSGTLSFAPGELTKEVHVNVGGDTVFETAETFSVNLSNPTNATIADGTGTGTITNDDAAPTLSIDSPSVSEGAGTITFIVTRTGATEVPIGVNYATADGSAVSIAGGPGTPDFTATSGTLNFVPSLAATQTQTFTVAITNDAVYEATEQFAANLSNPTGATISTGSGVGTITNDDAAPTLSIGNVSVAENGGPATFTVTLTGATSLPIGFSYATADGTAVATAGGPGTPDYAPTAGTLTFNPSASSTQTLTISVPLVNDTTDENTEQFFVNLSAPTNGATIGSGVGTGTITNDDPPPTVSINSVSQAEGNAGTTAFTFTVSLSQPSAKTVTVNFTTADGTAQAASDYVAASGAVTFLPGETSKPVTILVNGDTTLEPVETFTVGLSNPVNAMIANGTGTGTILDDDNHPPVGNNDSFALSENAIVSGNVLTNDTDVDPGQTLSVRSVTVGAVTTSVPGGGSVVVATLHGSLTIASNGSFTYDNDGSDATTDGFTYTLSDDGTDTPGHTATASVSFAISNVPPLVNAGPDVNVDQYVPLTGRTYSFTDPGAEGTWNVTIDFGDGSAPFATTVSAPGSYSVPAHTYTVAGTYNASVTVADGEATAGDAFQVVVAPNPLKVSSFAPTPSGFDVTFNRAFNPTPLNLYGTNPDVVVVGPDGRLVRGTLAWDGGSSTLSFVATDAYESPVGSQPARSGILAPGTYSVALISGASAFNDGIGNNLDGGAGDLVPGGDYTTQFTVAAPPAGTRIVSIDDFARAASSTTGQIVSLPDNAPAATAGLPINISDGTGVTRFTVTVAYDAALLVVSGFNAPAGWSVSMTSSNPGATSGRVLLTLSGSGPALPAGLTALGYLQASVRPNATYGDSQLLNVEVTVVATGPNPADVLAVVADDAVHSVNYVGDANKNKIYTSGDANDVLAQSTAGANPSLYANFVNYPNTDATVVADVNNNSILTSQDAQQVNLEATAGLGSGSLQIPAIPPGPAAPSLLLSGGASTGTSNLFSTVLGNYSGNTNWSRLEDQLKNSSVLDANGVPKGLFSTTPIRGKVARTRRG